MIEDKIVRPALHQNELHLIYELTNNEIGNSSMREERLKALKRLRKKISRNFVSIGITEPYIDHRHYVSFVKSRIEILEEEAKEEIINKIKEAENF